MTLNTQVKLFVQAAARLRHTSATDWSMIESPVVEDHPTNDAITVEPLPVAS
jgi:hypothetical protein